MNHYVLVATDSQAYLETAYQLVPMVNWPMGYGVMIRLALTLVQIHSLIPFVLFQVLAIAALTVFFLDACAPSLSIWQRLACEALLAGTALPWFATMVMTDVALFAVGALLAICSSGQVSRRVRIICGLGIVVLATTHYSLPPILTVASVALIAQGFIRHGRRPELLRWIAAGVIACWISIPALHAAFTGRPRFAGAAHVGLMAKLYEWGVLVDLRGDLCPAPSLHICRFQGRLKGSAGDYMWGGKLLDALGGFEGSRRESRVLIRAALLRYPWTILRHVVIDIVNQATSFQLSTYTFAKIPKDTTIDSSLAIRLPADHHRFVRSRQERGTLPLGRANLLANGIYALTAVGALALLAIAWRRRKISRKEVGAVFVLLSVWISNLLVTGALSYTDPRYGARVMPLWVLMFASAMAAVQSPDPERSLSEVAGPSSVSPR